ncbi:MAG TPA: hypothetical protein QGF58_05165 [Myxococcota bacterium]|nr:hypothetical protein [Myxococcota bacterium]
MTVLLGLLACSNECTDASRIAGTYSVFSSVSNHDNPEDSVMPTYAPFYNGEREWQLTYVGANSTFRILIEGQEFSAKYVPDSDNCNAFTLKTVGTDWTSDNTTLGDTGAQFSDHDVAWNANIIWQGDELSGIYSAVDTWQTSAGDSGVLTVDGTLSGRLVTDQE